jgi:hypothetical protein
MCCFINLDFPNIFQLKSEIFLWFLQKGWFEHTRKGRAPNEKRKVIEIFTSVVLIP